MLYKYFEDYKGKKEEEGKSWDISREEKDKESIKNRMIRKRIKRQREDKDGK